MEHVPIRPAWDCAACDQSWPCDPAREELVSELGVGTELAQRAWNDLEQYVIDASRAPGRLPYGEAFERFISWTRRVPLDGAR